MSEPIDYDDLCKRLSELAYDKESRLTGTPMIPLHEGTVIAVLDAINALRTDRDCRAGWLAQFVIDKFNGTPDLDGWVRRSATYYSELLQRAERAEADNAALRQDAERYRWLRLHYKRRDLVGYYEDHVRLDAAIDAERHASETSVALVEQMRLQQENAALRQQIANAIRLYPQLAERITSAAPDPSFGNPRSP